MSIRRAVGLVGSQEERVAKGRGVNRKKSHGGRRSKASPTVAGYAPLKKRGQGGKRRHLKTWSQAESPPESRTDKLAASTVRGLDRRASTSGTLLRPKSCGPKGTDHGGRLKNRVGEKMSGGAKTGALWCQSRLSGPRGEPKE